jgi:uncharacterized protein (DUF1330 family)
VTAYLFVEVLEVTDPAGMGEYVAQAPLIVERFGGRYLAAGADAEAVEGGWLPRWPTIIEFESPEAAKAYLSSVDYASLKRLRQASCRCNVIIIDGNVPQVPSSP